MKNYIIDASLIVTSLSDKSGQVNKKLQSLLSNRGTQLLSTVFLDFEVANAIRFLDRDIMRVKNYLDAFFELPIKKVDLSKGQIQKVVNMSFTNGTTVYDASYHFLAISRDGIFVTCNHEYFQKSHHLNHIQLLA